MDLHQFINVALFVPLSMVSINKRFADETNRRASPQIQGSDQ